MRKSAIFLCFALLIVMMILSGCTSSGSTAIATPAPTPTSTQTTPVPTKDIQRENDVKFLSAVVNYNDEMTTASHIFSNIITEQNLWVSKVDQTEQAYQNAINDLADEQAIANDINTRYSNAIQSAGRDVATIRTLNIQYQQDIADQNVFITKALAKVNTTDAARTAAKKPLDLKAKGFDITVLNATSSRVIDQLTPMPVSSDLQPVKDQYLTAISSYKKAGDTFVTAVNYYNKGQMSAGSDALKQTITSIDAANNQLDTCILKLQHYKNKIGA